MRRRGSTLIELLVVMAILALLISVLLPALAKAREQGKKVVCLSNLREIGTAIGLYLSDSDNLPWTYIHGPAVCPTCGWNPTTGRTTGE